MPSGRHRVAPARARGRTPRRPRSGRVRWIGGGLIGLLLVALLGAGLGGLYLKSQADGLQNTIAADLTSAANHLTAGKALVGEANTKNDPAPLTRAATEFDQARAKFRAAQAAVDGNRLIAGARSFGPAWQYVAPRKTAVDELAQMGLALADAGQDGADLDSHLIKPQGSQNAQETSGARLIDTIRVVTPGIPRLIADLQRASDHAALVNPAVLPSSQRASFLKARDQIATGLAGTVEFQTLGPLLLGILGADSPRTYLVEQVDPAELRGSGGFIGSYVLVHVDKGTITLGQSGDVYGIDYPYPVQGQARCVPEPAAVKEAFPTHCYVFGDSNFFPDFPRAATTGEDLFKRETGRTVDGVVSIDPWAVANMLAVTGPLQISEYGITVDAKTFPDVVVKRLLTEAANVPGKKNFFPVVANLVLSKLSSLPSEDWTNLLGKMNDSVTQRHMQVYFNKGAEETEMTRLGWTGNQIGPSTGEWIGEIESNYGGNKANYWLQRRFTLDLTYTDGRLHHRLSVSLNNQTPPGYEGGQLYRVYCRLYLPGYATGEKAGGLFADHYASDESPPGLKLLDGWYQVPAYSTYDRISFEWDTPLDELGHGHTVYWQKQAGTLADKLHVNFTTGGHTYTADGDLGQDRVLVLSSSGVTIQPGAAGSAKLPVLG